ncbi:MAG: helix-turn-helix transcriptional regulator [Bacteroides sp.]|nr:helix-turn-helix transcriptional regulator [Bacteroides sp.]
MHISTSRLGFSKFFRRNFGKTFVEHINDLRIDEARRQLKNTEKSVAAIAYDTGFTCIPYFNRLFRELCGMIPYIYSEKL